MLARLAGGLLLSHLPIAMRLTARGLSGDLTKDGAVLRVRALAALTAQLLEFNFKQAQFLNSLADLPYMSVQDL